MCYGSGKEKISPELKGRMYAEIAQYALPKRKAIEHTVEHVGSIAETLRQRRQERIGGSDASHVTAALITSGQ